MLRRQPKPRTFDYRPRYFDPDKEAFQQAKSPVEEDTDTGGRIRRISRHFREYHRSPSTSGHFFSPQREARRSNVRLFLILAGLLFLAYYLMVATIPQLEMWLR